MQILKKEKERKKKGKKKKKRKERKKEKKNAFRIRFWNPGELWDRT